MNMKLIFIIPRACTTYSGGVPVQGRMWKEGLEQNGDVVDLFSVWENMIGIVMIILCS